LVVVIRPYHVCKFHVLWWALRCVEARSGLLCYDCLGGWIHRLGLGSSSPNSAVGWVREGNGDIQVVVKRLTSKS